MMAQHLLQVFAGSGQRVGEVGFDSATDSFSFRYDPSWLKRREAFPLTPHIPLSEAPPRSGVIQRFLQNLLPEGRALDVASVFSQVSRDNVFALIALLGKEPVGALSFLPVDGTANRSQGEMRRVIPDHELSGRIRARDAVPFPVWDGKVRLSVAGYQDKLQVLVEGDRISLADAPLASTHILKPESRSSATPYMVANEHFCMTLAGRLGLPVAAVRIRRIPEPILLVERFDRTVTLAADGQTVTAVSRRHVIDACQALDMPLALKYERNLGNTEHVRSIREGVSFEKLFSLESRLADPLSARRFLLQMAVFQLLIGNSDAHGKNLSFFVERVGLVPAQLYDLVSVNVYGEAVEQDMAMAYGDEFDAQAIRAFDLADFAQRTRTPRRAFARQITLMAAEAKAIAPELAKADIYNRDGERAMVKAIADFVMAQAELLLRLAPEVPKISPDLL